MRGRATVGPFLVANPAAVASQPTIRVISCTKALVSRAFAVLARNWESLACRHGCVETCTFGGRAYDIVKACVEAQWLSEGEI
jgi:hypothetical protein